MTTAYFAKNILCATCVLATLFSSARAEEDIKNTSQSLEQSLSADASWTLRLPRESKVTFKGLPNFDDAGEKSGQIMYPAPNALGFLAAVLTHGAVVEAQKQAHKEQIQETANQVLSTYETVLHNYTSNELMQRGLQKISIGGNKKLIAADEQPGNDWLIATTPVFFMTQDQSAIILENSIVVYAPDAPTSVAYQNTIRVISEPRNDNDLAHFWTTDQGEQLKNESAYLFARSLEIAMRRMSSDTDAINTPQKTFRYLEGHDKKIERGYLVSEHCNRMIIRTLRGEFISVPALPDTASNANASEQCNQAASNTL